MDDYILNNSIADFTFHENEQVKISGDILSKLISNIFKINSHIETIKTDLPDYILKALIVSEFFNKSDNFHV